MTDFKVWSGLETIGGNIVEISTDQARVFCDFGLTGGSNKDQAKPGLSSLETTLVEGKLPQIPGVFDTSDFQTIHLASINDHNKPQAIFISHLHIDHMGGLKFLPEGGDVYMTKDSLKMYQALIAVGDEPAPIANLHGIAYDEPVTVGDIQVTFRASDHDILGISAVFIQTPDARLVHTGDFRLTGYHSKAVHALVDQINQFKANVVFIEGTAYSFDTEVDRIDSEKDLLEILNKCFKDYQDQLIVFNPYIRNVERIHYFHQQAKTVGRQVVLEADYAHVYVQFYPNDDIKIIYYQEILDKRRGLGVTEILANPQAYLLQNAYPNIHQLKILKPAVYLHSNGEPIGDYMAEYADMQNFLQELNIPLVSFGVSGHACKADLLTVAGKIQTEKIVPWHTFNPQNYGKLLSNLGLSVLHPDYDSRYTI